MKIGIVRAANVSKWPVRVLVEGINKVGAADSDDRMSKKCLRARVERQQPRFDGKVIRLRHTLYGQLYEITGDPERSKENQNHTNRPAKLFLAGQGDQEPNHDSHGSAAASATEQA